MAETAPAEMAGGASVAEPARQRRRLALASPEHSAQTADGTDAGGRPEQDRESLPDLPELETRAETITLAAARGTPSTSSSSAGGGAQRPLQQLQRRGSENEDTLMQYRVGGRLNVSGAGAAERSDKGRARPSVEAKRARERGASSAADSRGEDGPLPGPRPVADAASCSQDSAAKRRRTVVETEAGVNTIYGSKGQASEANQPWDGSEDEDEDPFGYKLEDLIHGSADAAMAAREGEHSHTSPAAARGGGVVAVATAAAAAAAATAVEAEAMCTRGTQMATARRRQSGREAAPEAGERKAEADVRHGLKRGGTQLQESGDKRRRPEVGLALPDSAAADEKDRHGTDDEGIGPSQPAARGAAGSQQSGIGEQVRAAEGVEGGEPEDRAAVGDQGPHRRYGRRYTGVVGDPVDALDAEGHRLMITGPIIWCDRCGRYATRRLGRALKAACCGNATGAYATRLSRLRRGLHPLENVPVV